MNPQDQRLVGSVVNTISIAFDIAESDAQATEGFPDAVRKALLDRIIELLNTNPEKLMSILYRIDVGELKVKEIFSSAFPPEIPEKLVDLVIERQLSKAYTRQAARNMQKE